MGKIAFVLTGVKCPTNNGAIVFWINLIPKYGWK
jgi:hypothetical protein